ncbi:unnamed protein product [Lampetra planeri]
MSQLRAAQQLWAGYTKQQEEQQQEDEEQQEEDEGMPLQQHGALHRPLLLPAPPATRYSTTAAEPRYDGGRPRTEIPGPRLTAWSDPRLPGPQPAGPERGAAPAAISSRRLRDGCR